MWIPWRETGNKGRKGIHDRKLVIYTLLEAKALGFDLSAFMKPVEEKAYAASEKSQKESGNTSTVMSQLVNMLSQTWKDRGMTPTLFEQDVLQWQLTGKARNQGSSKQLQTSEVATA